MPHLHGFVKTRKYKLNVPDDVNHQLDKTTTLFQRAVIYFLQVFQEHQELINDKQWLTAIEQLTHQTKTNLTPKYDFDTKFPNLPSGFRRSAIAEAHGKALAWQTNYTKWQKKKQRKLAKGKKFTERPPQYPIDNKCWLTYYSTEFKWLDKDHILLKVSTGKAYVYRKINLTQSFIVPDGYTAGSPTLVRKENHWEIHVPLFLQTKLNLQKTSKLVKDPILRICVVDLGIKRHAVVTIQDTKGRVYATLFISGAQGNHLRKKYLEKVSNLQSQTGVISKDERFAKDLWAKISNFNDNIAHKVSRQIVDFAKEHGAKIIVFEHLDNLRPSKGTKSHRLNHKLGHWVKGRTFRYSQYKALHEGITTCRVSPKYTSSKCPYCEFKSIIRYGDLAKCTNCKVHDVNSDFIGTLGIGRNFRLKHCA